METKQAKMVHLNNTAGEFVKELKNYGFKGVKFNQVQIETSPLECFLADGETEEAYEEYVSNYTIFIAVHDPESLERSDYANETEYYSDFSNELTKRFGEDVEFGISFGTVEIIRQCLT